MGSSRVGGARRPRSSPSPCAAAVVYAHRRAPLRPPVRAGAPATLFATSAFTRRDRPRRRPARARRSGGDGRDVALRRRARVRATGRVGRVRRLAAAVRLRPPACALVLVAHAAVLAFGRRPTRQRDWPSQPGVVTALAAPAVVRGARGAPAPARPAAPAQPGATSRARCTTRAGGTSCCSRSRPAAPPCSQLGCAAGRGGVEAHAARRRGPARRWRACSSSRSPARRWIPATWPSSTPALCAARGVGLVARLRLGGRRRRCRSRSRSLLSGFRVAQLERCDARELARGVAYALASRGRRTTGSWSLRPARISAFSFYAGRGRGSLTAGGPRVFVVVGAGDDASALQVSRRASRVPAYALRGERRFGSHLWVQEWDRTGLPVVARAPGRDRRARSPRSAAAGRRTRAGRARSGGAGSGPSPPAARSAAGRARS